MSESPEGLNYSEMKAELQALRKRLEDLESKQAASRIALPAVRRRFPNRLIIASISLAVLVVVSGLLWGQGEIKALFIDDKGNVGIGTTSPIVRLDVAGGPSARTGTHSSTAKALYVTGDFEHASGGVEFRHSNGTQGIGFGYDSIYATGSDENQNLNLMPRGTGRVGIGTITPTAGKKLDVVGDARVSASLTAGSADVTGSLTAGGDLNLGNSALYFTKTDHDHSGTGNAMGYAAIENSKNYSALMILGRTISTEKPTAEPPTKLKRVVGMWDRVGIGTGNPQAPLDVAGEIRGTLINGKPNWIGEYEWKQNPWEGQDTSNNHPTPMTKTDSSVCFLTAVSGLFYGNGEAVEIIQGGGYWKLNGRSQQKHVWAKAMCIGSAP
jgi:hypothetical protein